MNRNRFSKEFKAKVALEAICGHKTTAELASEYGAHPTQIGNWKKQALQAMPGVFSGKGEQQAIDLSRQRGYRQAKHDEPSMV